MSMISLCVPDEELEILKAYAKINNKSLSDPCRYQR